jgi:hypothetical protein
MTMVAAFCSDGPQLVAQRQAFDAPEEKAGNRAERVGDHDDVELDEREAVVLLHR